MSEAIDRFIDGQPIGEILPIPADQSHPFKGKIVDDIRPTSKHGWIIIFTDGTSFHI